MLSREMRLISATPRSHIWRSLSRRASHLVPLKTSLAYPYEYMHQCDPHRELCKLSSRRRREWDITLPRICRKKRSLSALARNPLRKSTPLELPSPSVLVFAAPTSSDVLPTLRAQLRYFRLTDDIKVLIKKRRLSLAPNFC